MSILANQTAIITGAGSGIGRAVAEGMAREGAAVVLVGRGLAKLEATAKAIDIPERVALVAGDVREPQTAARAVGEAQQRFGALDIVVSNAALCEPTPFPQGDAEQWRSVFDVVLGGACNFARAAASAMIEQGRAGRIVNVTSIHGTRGEPSLSAYGAAKAAVDQFTRCLAIDLAPHNIRVNAVAPGFVDTPMSVIDGVNELETELFQREYVGRRRIPLARAGRPEEIAACVLFLASEASSYVNGHVLVVDGGLTCTF